MNIEELRAFLGEKAAIIERNVEQQSIIAANDLAQQIKLRVTNSGKDAQGGAFTPYSTTQMPSFFYFGKSRNASAEQRVQRSSKKTLSYKDFRTLNGLETNKKNFEFTGDMWRNFGVVDTKYSNGIVSVTIGGTSDDAANKIAWLSAQEKNNIVEPNATEVQGFQDHLEDWIRVVLTDF
jgi:hypothetical protein